MIIRAMTPGQWFHCAQPSPDARFRLFCFPHAGGGAATYSAWPRHLSSDIEVRAARLPGRESRMNDAPVVEMSRLVEGLADALAPHVARPYAFFGHSMGAIVAFELARHLRLKGRPLPVHLFVSARRAPHVVDREPPCHGLPEAEFVNHLVRRYNGIPGAILAEPELMNLFLPVLRADFRLIETYRYVPGDPLDQPLTVFGGTQDPMTTRDDLHAWRDMTRGGYRLHMMPGGHFFLQRCEVEVLRVIAQELADS